MAIPFVDKIATTDPGYTTGVLSLYPRAQDTLSELYVVANNAQTVTTQSTPYNGSYFIVDDTTGFPSEGLILVGTEQVYYTAITSNTFQGLKRGFAGSRQDAWPIGTSVIAAVCAEPHNALKDAILNIERNLGLYTNPDPLSLNGLLKALEVRFLAPRPLFRADPRFGAPPITVTFQNFSEGPAIRYFWEFGDGATSQDFAPVHVYQAAGVYTVTLNMITSLGAQGVVTKTGYITVNTDELPAFFYNTPSVGTTSTTFTFVDQTDGSIASRYWVWDDGNSTSILDPDVHTATYQYASPGTYNPSLLVVFTDDTKKIVQATESVQVM